MGKIAYNACYGGFSLSHEGILRYAEIKGIKLYPEKDRRFDMWTYWTVPADQRGDILSTEEFMRETDFEKRRASNEAFSRKTLPSDRNLERHDPVLIQVIEELGDKANGRYAKLKIEDVESGTLYRIDEYDGMESVATRSTYEWKVAP